MQIKPIGIIHTPFTVSAGTPIQPGMAAGTEGKVEVFEEYKTGLKDIDGFERIWLVYWFDRASLPKLLVTPYLDTLKRGLFATRAPARPNPIGISPVRLIEVAGNILRVSDIDILDGTPLLDIKPYSSHFDRFEVERNGWLDTVSKSHPIADNRFENTHIRRTHRKN